MVVGSMQHLCESSDFIYALLSVRVMIVECLRLSVSGVIGSCLPESNIDQLCVFQMSTYSPHETRKLDLGPLYALIVTEDD